MSNVSTFMKSRNQAVDCGARFSAKASSIVACVLLAALLGACGAPRPIKYYQLSYPTLPASQQSPLNVTILVRTFEASTLFKDDRIVYNTSPIELGIYDDSRWVNPPVEMLQDAFIRGLRASGRYRSVMTVRGEGGGDYALTGHLYEFGEFDGTEVSARLNFVARLRERKTGLIVWTHTYNHDEPAGEKTVPAVVTAMDKNVQRSVEEIRAGLDEYFRTNPPK